MEKEHEQRDLFHEVNEGYTILEAINEAKRCLHCKVPSCRKGCPISQDIPDWINEISKGNFGNAMKIINDKSNLPAVCGRVCPHEKQCEGHCVLTKKGQGIHVGKLERFIADFDGDMGLIREKLQPKTRGRVAVIGSGPAGLTIAGDLARMAGLHPAACLIEILNEVGTMARMPQLQEFAREHGLHVLTIRDLIAYRLREEREIEMGDEVDMPTEYGHFRFIPFRQKSSGKEHAVLIKGEWQENEPVLVRVHSSCVTGDIFGSRRCDCGEQLHKAMEMIDKEGKGVVLYLNQEGRGIGLMAKIAA